MAVGDELASLDFQSMIGGPLSAVVRAQADAAITSVDFIKEVGFDPDEQGKPVMVTFEYDKAVESTAENGTVTVEVRPFRLTAPILTMLPIPFIRVEETKIDFNAKIFSVQEARSSGTRERRRSGGFRLGKVVNLKGSFSSKRSTSASSKIERTFSLGVQVRAVQDELPAGTERLLGILENVITEVPSGS